MSHYSLTDRYVINMPIKRFWLLSSCIDRMNAADDIRGIRVAAAVLSKESYEEVSSHLTETIGEISKKEFYLDVDAINDLKKLLTR